MDASLRTTTWVPTYWSASLPSHNTFRCLASKGSWEVSPGIFTSQRFWRFWKSNSTAVQEQGLKIPGCRLWPWALCMAAHYTHAQKHQAEWSKDREHLEFPNHSVGNPTNYKNKLQITIYQLPKYLRWYLVNLTHQRCEGLACTWRLTDPNLSDQGQRQTRNLPKKSDHCATGRVESA